MINKIISLQKKHEDNINLWLNKLAVIYMFFIPSIPHSRTVSLIYALIYILILLRGNYIKYIKISLSHPLTKPFLLFMLMQIVWIFGSSSIETTFWWEKYAYYSLYPFLFFLFLDQRFYTRLIASFILGVMVTELLSYLMQFHIIPWGYNANFQFPWKSTGDLTNIIFYNAIKGEPTPFFDHSLYSVLIALTASILLSKTIYVKSIYTKLITYLFFTTLSINLFFVGGRTGYLLYGILVTTTIYYAFKNKIPKIYIAIIISLPIFLGSYMYQTDGILKKRVLHTIEIIQSSSLKNPSDTRMKLAIVGLDTVKDSIIFGHGTGADAVIIMRDKKENKNSAIQKLMDVHNQYIDILLQFGLIGLMVYLNVIYKTFKYTPINNEQAMVKTLVLFSMISVGFFSAFTIFFPTLFVMLLIISTTKEEIIKQDIKPIGKLNLLFYILFIIAIYFIGQVQ